ncbi:unnamed protein product, partial [marine sediment metagenome]
MKEIYCLFSVDNEYDQPSNNLVCAWEKKPDLDGLGKALEYGFPHASDEITLGIVGIWKGEDIRLGDTDYRLEQY